MQAAYDPQSDTLVITISSQAPVESVQAEPGLILEYDGFGNVVSVEVLNASQYLSDPSRVSRGLDSEADKEAYRDAAA